MNLAQCTASRILLSVAAALATCAPATAQSPRDQLRAGLDKLFDARQWRSAHWGVKVIDLTSSEVLYTHEAEKEFMPASNMKLYTTAAALKTLGQNFRYETKIYANGPVSKSGVLRGDIVIVGSGDPSISGRYNPADPAKPSDTPTTGILRQWTQALRDAGIRSIEGSVIGDDNCFDDRLLAGSWQLDYYQDWYAAESSGLSMNENCYDFVITPGKKVGDPANIQIELPTRYITLKNEVSTTGPMRLRPTDDPPLAWSRPLDKNELTFKGFMPIDMPRFKHWASVHNGTLYCATLLVEELKRQGITVRGGPKDIDDLKDGAERVKADRLKLIHTHLSPPISSLVKTINKPSQNFYADQLLKTMGIKFRGEGSFSAGEKVVKDLLTSAGLEASSYNTDDGSGLSRQDLVQPQMTAGLLAYMAKQPEFAVYYDSLPIAGVDGTIRTRFRNTPAQGNVHAKTGTINRVRSLSGYVDDKDKHRLAFSMMANNYMVETARATDTQDSATLMLVNYSEAVPAATTTATETATTATTTPQ